jgi:hypothetical protein
MTIEIPADLVVTVWQSPDEFTVIPVRQILDVPTGIKGVSDGPQGFAAPPERPFILFDAGWHKDLAGRGFEDFCRMAAEIASHLAAINGDWPSSGEAHVRSLPVVDTKFSFVATPRWSAPGEDPRAAGLEKLLGEIAAANPELAGPLRMMASEMAACGECGRS